MSGKASGELCAREAHFKDGEEIVRTGAFGTTGVLCGEALDGDGLHRAVVEVVPATSRLGQHFPELARGFDLGGRPVFLAFGQRVIDLRLRLLLLLHACDGRSL
jgi:hypothetical protein